MSNYGEILVRMLDGQVEADNNEDGLRTHLGASVLGEKCLRAVWFGFRWADTEEFEGRMLRLFARGQKAESSFADLLRSVGATVWTEDDHGKQFRVSAFGGHLGGSKDGVAINLPHLPDGIPAGTACLVEMKTHNDKSFKDLKAKGVTESKPKHYKQAQLYMHFSGLKWCLYMAVNKNTDELYCEFFPYVEHIGTFLVNRGETVIFGEGIPPRIADSPSWYECKFCAFHGICHGTKMPKVNCRTCVHSSPERDGTWRCRRGKSEIKHSPKVGCSEHLFTPYIFPALTPTVEQSDALGPVRIGYTGRKGYLVNGKNAIASQFLSLC